MGNLSFIAAYYLTSKGFEQISNLQSGLIGWKMRYSDLYQKYAGQNITVLQPVKNIKN
jgi:rhodanese-related sulfurtransferase